jgi:multicomponent Na+:H+ antiporter subunit D
LLAYSTIAHVGLFLLAAGCLTESGTAGALLYVVGHAGVKSALFLLAGVMLNRYGSVDEVDLFGRGRDTRITKWLFVIAGLALAGLPPFGTGIGKAVGEEAGLSSGYEWMPVVFVAVSAFTGGAVLRATARVYFGWGDRPRGEKGSTSGSAEEAEVPTLLSRVRITMLVPILVLLFGALAVGVLPGAHHAAERAAGHFIDASAYAREALTGHAAPAAATPEIGNWTASGVLLGLLSAALAVAVASMALYARRLRLLERTTAGLDRGTDALRALHSGHVGDYVAWMMAGMTALGALVGLPLR